jgi:hypothetical protein
MQLCCYANVTPCLPERMVVQPKSSLRSKRVWMYQLMGTLVYFSLSQISIVVAAMCIHFLKSSIEVFLDWLHFTRWRRKITDAFKKNCCSQWPVYLKSKAILLQAWTGPEGSRRLRLPDFKTICTWRWYVCQPYAPAAFTPRKYSWYSFLLEAESTPGP